MYVVSNDEEEKDQVRCCSSVVSMEFLDPSKL